MENKITFFTFSNSKNSYDEGLVERKNVQIEKYKREIKQKEIELENLLKRYKRLSKEEREELKSYEKNLVEHSKILIEVFRDHLTSNMTGSSFRMSAQPLLHTEKIENQIALLLDGGTKSLASFKFEKEYLFYDRSNTAVKKLKKTFFNKLKKELGKKHDLSKVIELKKQYSPEIEQLDTRIETLKASIAIDANQERIESKDIENLNEEISAMNQKGWKVKQMEGIQSGEKGLYSDGGYGYSFTKGILILWEKNE